MNAWGWWRSHDGPLETLAPVLADWMEQYGQQTWAAWFRDDLEPHRRLERFFGPPNLQPVRPDAMALRVLVGAIPVSEPPTMVEGPWFRAVHVVLEGTDQHPGFEEFADVPCMARVQDLIVHQSGIEQAPGADDGHQLARALSFADVAPLSRTLEGLWCMDGVAHPGGLASLSRLVRLSTPLAPGHWHHPTVTTLFTRCVDDPGMVDLPALRNLDIEGGNGDLEALLAQVPSIQDLVIDEAHGTAVVKARSSGHLPNLRRVQVWGAAPELTGVRVEERASLSREQIRMTADWIFDRALRIAV